MNKLKRQNEGITLIALVVTIVVLKQAKNMQINAQEQEDHTLNEIAKTIRELHTR